MSSGGGGEARAGTPEASSGVGARVAAFARGVETAVLVLLLATLVVLASAEIVARNFGEGLAWAGQVSQLLVLWLGMVGAVAASGERRHVTVDVFSRFLRGRAAHAVRLVVDLVTVVVAGVLAFYSWRFLLEEREWGASLLTQLPEPVLRLFGRSVGEGVPAWWLEAILPAAFALIAWRYAFHVIADLIVIVRGEARAGDGDATADAPPPPPAGAIGGGA